MKVKPFTMSVEKQGDIPVVKLVGDIEDDNAPSRIKETMLDLIEKKQVYLIVDLSETTFLDDSVLGVLIGTLKRLRELDGTLVLVCSNPKIIRVFEHTGLDKIFDIAKSLDEAIEITKSMKTAPAS